MMMINQGEKGHPWHLPSPNKLIYKISKLDISVLEMELFTITKQTELINLLVALRILGHMFFF